MASRMLEKFSSRNTPSEQNTHRDTLRRALDRATSEVDSTEYILDEARLKAEDLPFVTPRHRSSELPDGPAVVLRPTARFREYTPQVPSRVYSSDHPNQDLEPQEDQHFSYGSEFGYGERKQRSSFDALVDELDALDQKVSMRKGALEDKTVRNPGRPRRSHEKDWERTSAAQLMDRANWRAVKNLEEPKRDKLRRLMSTYYSHQGESVTPEEYELAKNAIHGEFDLKAKNIDSDFDAQRAARNGMHWSDIDYVGGRMRAKNVGRYPEQKPTYKDKIGRPTIRGWDENLVKEDMDPDEALEIELELRRMEEAFHAERARDQKEGVEIEKRILDERALDEIERRIGERRSSPSREASLRYGSLGYDSDSVVAARRMSRDVDFGMRRQEDRRGFRPAQKPIDPYRENRLQRESFRDLE